MERLSIFAKHAADDGAHHHSITKATVNETAEEEKRQVYVDKVGETKLGASKCRIGFNIIRKAKI